MFLCLMVGAQAGAEGPYRALEIGERLVPLSLAGLNGPSRPLDYFRGKPLIINLWASWCEPCRDEMKSFDRLAWLPIGQRINIIGVSTDDSREAAREWLLRSNATINQYIDTKQQLESLLGATSIPLTVLVGADGKVLARVRGARQWDSEESIAMIRRVLAP